MRPALNAKSRAASDDGGALPFFARSDWAAAGLVSAVALAVYVATLAPCVTFEQSGALIVAGQYMGVGRVPGYPVWHLLAKLFTTAFWFVRYRGQPNPAWSLNFMSACFGALSCGLVALMVSGAGRRAVGEGRAPVPASARAFAAAVVAGLLLVFSPALWSQSVITETHTLTLFLMLLFLALVRVWFHQGSGPLTYVLPLTLGVGLAQSHMLALLVPPYLLAICLVDRTLARDVVLTALAATALPCLVWQLPVEGPWLAAAMAFTGVLCLCVPLRLLPRGRTAVWMVSLLACGLSLYAYLPLAAELNPRMMFSYSRTWEGFKHVITRGQYERIMPSNVLEDPVGFLKQLRWYVGLLVRQYGVPLVWVGLVPLWRVPSLRGVRLKWWAVLLATFVMFSLVLVIGVNPRCDVQDTFIQRAKFIPSFALWGIFVGHGVLMLLGGLGRIWGLRERWHFAGQHASGRSALQ